MRLLSEHYHRSALLRAELRARIKPLETSACPFANLPEKHAVRWSAGLAAVKMAECRWLEPVLVGHFEFVERTPDGHLRHPRFIVRRENRKATEVRQEEFLNQSPDRSISPKSFAQPKINNAMATA